MSKIVEDWDAGFLVNRYGPDICVELAYPRGNDIKAVQVGLNDVRSADNIRVSYDFARDGWVIQQASVFEWNAADSVMDPDWQEVAFVQSWGRQRVPTSPTGAP